MKKIPGRIRAVLLVMAIAFSGVFLAPGTASAFNYDIKDTTVVCDAYDEDGDRHTILVESSVHKTEGCDVFHIWEHNQYDSGDYPVFEFMGLCANYGGHAYLDVACADGNKVINSSDWTNANGNQKDHNCLFRVNSVWNSVVMVTGDCMATSST